MSKESRERMKAQKERMNSSSPISKRKFFRNLGIFLGVPGLAGLGYKIHRENELDFIDREISDPNPGMEIIELNRKYPKLGPVYGLATDSQEKKVLWESLRPEIEKRLMEKGLERDAFKGIHVKRRLYGVPPKWPFDKQALKYCRKAEEILHQEIKGLQLPQIKWTIVKNGDNYENNADYRGFITDGFYQSQIANILGEDEKILFNLGDAMFHTGGVSIPSREGSRPFFIVAANNAGIISPFSEMAGMIAEEPAYKYSKIAGMEESLLLQEAFSEAVSADLGKKLLLKLGIKDADQRIKDAYSNADKVNRYKYVWGAINWTDKNGIQATHDLFMEDMDKYGKVIKSR